MESLFHNLQTFWAWFRSPSACENEPGFKRTLESIAQSGMQTAGHLGAIGASFYVLARILTGSEFSWWSYGDTLPNPVVLWNKVLIAGLGVVLVVASRRRLDLRTGRSLMAFFLLVAAFSLIWEDVQAGDFMFTAAWVAMAMFFAVGTVPFKAWQTTALCITILVVYAVFQGMDESLTRGIRVARLIFLGIVSLLCGTMSAAIYRSRAKQFLTLAEFRRTLRSKIGTQEIPVRPSEVSVKSADDKFVDEARLVVERHIDDSSFDITMFAQELNVSARQLQRKLRAITDQRPTDFVRLIRLQRAAQLLEQRAGSVSEIAYSVGFNYPEHFTKCFRELYGVPPSSYMEAVA